jgi:predicted TIM-barrel fold metal-dependent hydrolase
MTLQEIGDLDVVVSADEHMSERVEDFVDYIDDEAFGGIKKVIQESNDPMRDVFSVTLPLPPFPLTSSGSEYAGDDVLAQGETKLETKLNHLDEFDIDYGILNPTVMVALPTVNNTQAAAALTDGFNQWVYETFASESDRLYMPVLVPGQDPEFAAREIEKWADEDQVLAVQVGATGHRFPVSHQWWDPIYEAAETHDLPVMYHSSFPSIGHGFPLQHRWHELFAEDKVISHPYSHMWNITKLIYEGIPEKYPDLTFVFQEAGIGWIPYWRMRLDRFYLAMGEEMPALNKLPSNYIDDRFYFTTQPVGHSDHNPDYLSRMVELASPENLMYSADIPHSDFDTPEELFTPIKSDLPAEQVRGIMGETALEVFDMG